MQRMLVGRERRGGAAENKRERRSDLVSVEHGHVCVDCIARGQDVSTNLAIAMHGFLNGARHNESFCCSHKPSVIFGLPHVKSSSFARAKFRIATFRSRSSDSSCIPFQSQK
jgi:hypothetical protein